MGMVTKGVNDVDRTTAVTELFSDIKAFMRVDHDDEDALIRTLIDVACASLEDKAGMSIRPHMYTWTVKDFDKDRSLIVDHMPVQRVVITDTDTNTDVTLTSNIFGTYEDHVFYVRPPQDVKNFRLDFASGIFSVMNIWTLANIWVIPDVWTDDSISSRIFDRSLIRQAIYLTVAELYKQRELTSSKEQFYVPSAVEYIINPIRRIYGA